MREGFKLGFGFGIGYVLGLAIFTFIVDNLNKKLDAALESVEGKAEDKE